MNVISPLVHPSCQCLWASVWYPFLYCSPQVVIGHLRRGHTAMGVGESVVDSLPVRYYQLGCVDNAAG